MSRIMMALGAMALLAGAPAMAQGPQRPTEDGRGPSAQGPHGPPDPMRMFAEMDANHDGVISRAEFMAFHASHGRGGPGGPGERHGPPPHDGGPREGGRD